MFFRETSKNLAEAKCLEQKAVVTALMRVVEAYHARELPLGEALENMPQHDDGSYVGAFLRLLRKALLRESSPFLRECALAIFVGAPLFDSLRMAVDGLPRPSTTLDLFSVTRRCAEEVVARSGHTPWYYLRHPRIVWSALMSMYLGSRLLGWLSPFDPKAFARNTSGRIFTENFTDPRGKALAIVWTVGPTPTIGDHLAGETVAAIEALRCKESICFPYTMWVYVNLQNRCGMSEGPRSLALFEASQKAPATFRLASVSVDAPFYLGSDEKLSTLQDHKHHLLKELRKGLSPSSSDWYAFSLLDGEHEEWWDCVEKVVEKACCLAETTERQCTVFHELVVLGLVRSWQAFCCRGTAEFVMSTVACKECADRGGSVNAAFLWAMCDGDEMTRARTVEAVLWGRPLLVRQRLIEKRRTQGFEALVDSLHSATVCRYLNEVWDDACHSRWQRKDAVVFSKEDSIPCP